MSWAAIAAHFAKGYIDHNTRKSNGQLRSNGSASAPLIMVGNAALNDYRRRTSQGQFNYNKDMAADIAELQELRRIEARNERRQDRENWYWKRKHYRALELDERDKNRIRSIVQQLKDRQDAELILGLDRAPIQKQRPYHYQPERDAFGFEEFDDIAP